MIIKYTRPFIYPSIIRTFGTEKWSSSCQVSTTQPRRTLHHNRIMGFPWHMDPHGTRARACTTTGVLHPDAYSFLCDHPESRILRFDLEQQATRHSASTTFSLCHILSKYTFEPIGNITQGSCRATSSSSHRIKNQSIPTS